MPLFLFLSPLQHVKRSALQNKQVVILRMAFRARKVLGTFEKQASGACFSKVPKFFGRILGDIILFVSSKRRRLEARNFAVIFIPLTTCEKISFTEKAGRNFTNGFSGPKCFRDFRETGPWDPFLESPETSGAFRVTILFVSSKPRCLEARNFAVILIFIPFTRYDKSSFTE